MLPSLTLGLFQMTLILRLVRAEMLEVLRADYIKFARARGLTNRAVNYRHALKNTLVPVITIIGLQFGNIFAFSIIVETVFQWPGLGLLVIQSIQFADVPLLAAYLVMIALGFAVLNLAVDLLYAAIDPRVRTRHDLGEGARMSIELHRADAQRWWDSDLAYDFRRSPVAIVATIVTIVLIASAIGADFIAPYDVNDPASANVIDARLPPGSSGMFGGYVPARHRSAGPRHALRGDLRPAHVAAGRRAERAARGDRRHRARPASAAISAAGSTR